MVEESIRTFLTEKINYGYDYIPVVHGQNQSLKPLMLMEKQKRDVWKLPYAKTDMKIIGKLEELVVNEKKQEFEELATSLLETDAEVFIRTEEGEKDSSSFDSGPDVVDAGAVSIKLSDGPGDFLHLGHVHEVYCHEEKPDSQEKLLSILSTAEMNDEMRKYLEGHQSLLLITAVVYSDKFETNCKGQDQTDVDGPVEAPSPFAALLEKHAEEAGVTLSLPSFTTRNEPGPFLIRICEVDYDKETRRLKLRDGDNSKAAIHRDIDEEKYKRRYNGTVVDSGKEKHPSKDTDKCKAEDWTRMDNIWQKLLITADTTEQRKQIVRKYVNWSEEILTCGQKRLPLKTPLTAGDCEFFRLLFIPAAAQQTELHLETLSDEGHCEIHKYGVLFKLLHALSEKEWEELNKMCQK